MPCGVVTQLRGQVSLLELILVLEFGIWNSLLGQQLKVEIWLTFWNGAKVGADLGWELAPCLAAVGQPVWAAR